MAAYQHDCPRLVDTGRGFSVYYNDRYLYSQYNPVSAPEKTAAAATGELRPNTLILCCSPLLGYGLQTLLAALPESCIVLAVEFDPELYRFSCGHLPPDIAGDRRFLYIQPSEPEDICTYIAAKGDAFSAEFRRCITLDLSGGSAFFRDKYRTASAYTADYIATFWKNRMTLIRLGKLYATNMIRNAALIPASLPFPAHSIQKPVLVLGAGPSLEKALPFIREHENDLFILAVESAVQPLVQTGIFPDAVAAVESQLANSKAFIGSADMLRKARQYGGKSPFFFTDITSRTAINRRFAGRCCFFASAYTTAPFFTAMTAACAPGCIIPPLGSVGLAALEIALHITAGNVPVFAAGLDFSFPAENTHAKGTPQYTAHYAAWNRLSPPGNPPPSLAAGVQKATGKQNAAVYTDPALLLYARLAAARFGGNPRIYDIGETGLDLGIQQTAYETAAGIISAYVAGKPESAATVAATADMPQKAAQWLAAEISNLTFITEALTGGTVPFDTLRTALQQSSYLYLHFPDGCHEITADPSFLKRVKAETVFFLKQLHMAQNELSAYEREK